MVVAEVGKKQRQEKTMSGKRGSAFITTRKGFCYLTIKCYGRNLNIMRIRAYTLDADDKRWMRRSYPGIDFDWKKITWQLAEKRQVCRRYRSRRRSLDTMYSPRARASFRAIYEPGTRTIYTDGFPMNPEAFGTLLDAVLHIDRTLKIAGSSGPSEGTRQATRPNLHLIQGGARPEHPQRRGSDDC